MPTLRTVLSIPALVALPLTPNTGLSLSGTAGRDLPGLLPRLRAGTRHSGGESGPTRRTFPTRTSGITDRAGAATGHRPERALPAPEWWPPHPLERASRERRSRTRSLVRVKLPAGPYSGTMSGAPSRAASAVRSSGWRWDSRSASTRFS